MEDVEDGPEVVLVPAVLPDVPVEEADAAVVVTDASVVAAEPPVVLADGVVVPDVEAPADDALAWYSAMSKMYDPFPPFPLANPSYLAQLASPPVLSAAHARKLELLAQMLSPSLTMPPPTSVHETNSWLMVRDRLSKKSPSSYEPGDRHARQPFIDVYHPSGLGMQTQDRMPLLAPVSFWHVSIFW